MKSNCVKFIAVVMLFVVGKVNAQEVDTIDLNGERYFVYPFKVEVKTHSDYYSILDSKRNRRDEIKEMKSLVEDMDGEMSDELIEVFMREMDMEGFGKDDRKFINKKFRKAARANPYPLIENRYTLDYDLIPSLDPIPDGKYVQLFELFCLTDEKGKCRPDSNRIAAYFNIKNNMLEGEAYWLNYKGDTLKSGSFKEGVKNGVWKNERRRMSYSISEGDAQMYIEDGFPFMDTTITYTSFVNGTKTGKYQEFERSNFPIVEGYYLDDQKVGEWIRRDIRYDRYTDNGYPTRNRENASISSRFTLAGSDDTTVVKHPWIRKGTIDPYGYDDEEFDFNSLYRVVEPERNLFDMAFKKEEDLDLDEEEYGSYEFHDIEEYGYYDDYDFESREMYYGSGTSIYDENRGAYFDRSYVIDSIGMIANYKNVMEKYYPNGQLAFKYDFKDGALVKEDTLFWDNGKAHDVIIFNADSNHYERAIYDYEGKLYSTFLYDSLGDYKRQEKNFTLNDFVMIDGFKTSKREYDEYFFYDVHDTLDYDIKDAMYIFKSWHEYDTTKMFQVHFDPNTKLYTEEGFSMSGKSRYYNEKTFGPDYDSWTGFERRNYQNLELYVTKSGSLIENFWASEIDTLPLSNVKNVRRRFKTASEYVLKRDDEPFTGDVEFNFNKGKTSISTKSLKINFSKAILDDDKLEKIDENILKQYEKFKETGKSNEVLDYYGFSRRGRQGMSEELYSEMFGDILQGFFDFPSIEEMYHYDYMDSDKSDSPTLTRVEGYMLDGKPHGIWTGYDQKNRVISIVPYENGEVHGKVKEFELEQARSKSDYYLRQSPFDDSIPPKDVFYKSYESEYINGMKDGQTIYYNWLGEVYKVKNYREGYKEGEMIERNKLAFTRSNYMDGVLDGYVQTYLTLPGKDSILLYDLNFQDGALQGESKSYHLNGNLSKRGFFLTGEPIEDYEAYDSLGFKYHYVKFKYSYPVEEKIWEENELSVRYEFDWQDSIRFSPDDITNSNSLERMLIDLGFGSNYLRRPYRGRPTLVQKRGVEYTMTKYYPNDTIARKGKLDNNKKKGLWKFYDYDGELLYQVDYKDSVFALNDSIKFKSKGIYTDYSSDGDSLFSAHIIEKFEKYDCSHTDHYEIRQLYTIWQASDTMQRMNGYVRNYYDNGVLQNEGELRDGLPTGVWKFYDPFGKLNQYGQYVLGKRNGRWLSGDLSKTKYLGDICLNPNMPDLDDVIKYRENLLDITITNYRLGRALNKQFYDVNMNRFIDKEDDEESDELEPKE